MFHHYTLLFLFFIFIVGVYVVFLPRISQKMNKGGQGKHPLPKVVVYFCIMTVLAVLSLVINYLRSK